VPAPAAIEPKAATGTARSWLQKGIEFYRYGQFDHACRAFWAATMVSPEEAEYRIYLARSLAMMQGRALEAEQEFLKAIEYSPQNADFYAELGLFYQKINLFKKATLMFQKALALAPNHPLAR